MTLTLTCAVSGTWQHGQPGPALAECPVPVDLTGQMDAKYISYKGRAALRPRVVVCNGRAAYRGRWAL